MDDLISKMAAIDALMEQFKRNPTIAIRAKLTVEGLPSAQPEIIRCKGCKHKHLENAVWTCPFGLPGGPDFYCGYGAERRADE